MDKTVDEKIYNSNSLLLRYMQMILSLFISAILYNLLLQPINMVMGGANGIAIINKYQNNIEPFITIFIVSIIMLILSFIFLGKKRTLGTIVGSLLYPLFVFLTKDIVNYINIDMSDLLVISIFIGVISGISNGMLYKTGFSNGGLPIISQIIFKYFHIPIGKCNLFINSIIIIIGGFLFGANMVMYALIAMFINSIIVDRIVLGISKNKAVYIITDKKEKVQKFLIKDMKHTATIFNIKGGLLNSKKEMILTVIPTAEYFKITESIKVIDPDVFYVVNNAYEVNGGK